MTIPCATADSKPLENEKEPTGNMESENCIIRIARLMLSPDPSDERVMGMPLALTRGRTEQTACLVWSDVGNYLAPGMKVYSMPSKACVRITEPMTALSTVNGT